MEIIKENTTRKLDTMGRVSIPKSIRDRFGLKEGSEMEFFIGVEGGKNYIMFSKFEEKDYSEMAIAARVLNELGLDVPDELMEYL